MKSITKLKDEARKHEQKEEWEKAIKVYLQVLEAGEDGEGGEVELPLFNRVGDLYVRLNRSGDAVKYYEQAADRYADAGLYNNAIALCNKALRYLPSHVELLRKLGQFSASQGFITDARRYFLEYAEKKFTSGDTEVALSALEDFANVADDAEVRELLGRRLQQHGRGEEAVGELKKAYEMRVAAGQSEAAEALRGEILKLDETAFEHASPSRPHASVMHTHEPPAALPGLAEISLGEITPAPPAETAPAAPPEPEAVPDEFAIELPGLDEALPEEAAAGAMDAGLLEGFESTAFEGFEAADAGMLSDLEAATEFEAPAELPTLDPADLGLDRPSLEAPEEESLPGLELTGFEDSTGTIEDLPSLDEEEQEGEAFALPLLDSDEYADAEPLPTIDFGELPESEAPLPTFETEAGEFEVEALPTLDDEPLPTLEEAQLPTLEDEPPAGLETEPASLDADAGLSEISFETFEEPEPEPEQAWLDEAPAAEAATPEPSVETSPEEPVEAWPEPEPVTVPEEKLGWDPSELGPAPPAPPPPPPAAKKASPPSGGFIDLGSLLAEDDDETQEDTRFVVQEKAPTGDEDRDFAELLSQFKQKVAEHVSAEDAAAHYDLGLAFKEMGLIDEAISEFQIALRAGDMRLKVYEELGQCFLEKEQYNIAEKVLRKAMESPYKDELELLGVYYHLGRAYEGLGRREQARDAYERVLGLDINFGDVSERLARL